jgi:hypothetical protein
MKKDCSKILTLLRGLHPTLKEKYNVESIELFGSYSTNSYNSKSDVDILVTFTKIPSLLKFIELENFLSDRLGIKVDLVMRDSVKPLLKNYILNSAIPV